LIKRGFTSLEGAVHMDHLVPLVDLQSIGVYVGNMRDVEKLIGEKGE
jgi:hypothetical protein